MKKIIMFMVVAATASQVYACPPSPPPLYAVAEGKQTKEFNEDYKALNEAQSKLWANCHEHAANDCEAQCDKDTLAKFSYVEADVHYQYSASEREAATKLMHDTEEKWKAK